MTGHDTPHRPGALAGIGNTPLVKLTTMPGADSADVWVKLEAANPTGSYKDRMALAMIEGAERSGALSAGQTVVEYTGGSTGSSLAFVCALRGYPLKLVSSNAFSEEKIATMRAFGADVELIHSDTGIHPQLITQMMDRVAEIVEQEGAFPTDQFNNLDLLDGYLGIGRELVNQLQTEINGVAVYVGVGGAYTGTTRPIKERWPQVIRTVVEPAESAVISGEAPGTHSIEGGGVGFVPPLITPDSFDRVERVSTREACETARQVARTEGVFTGPSGGASMRAALRLARDLGPGQTVVTVQPDSGLKYLSGDLYS
ncbi:MAG: cysteine synthase family protein [Acidimicrobiia bacterium]|nr:cysteine synthase family protein [Acidimicrobiia bacterium]MDH5292132.1 cysteine synthase family protein [Acidimicrobiia bacterium]